MKIMKPLAIIFLVVFVFFPFVVLGEEEQPPEEEVMQLPLPNPLPGVTSLWGLIIKISNFVAVIAYGLAPIAIVIAGYFFLFSGGEPGKIATAKKIVVWTVAGVLVVSLARVLVSLLCKIFGTDCPPF